MTTEPGKRLVYHVTRHEADGEVWYECPICGRLTGAVARGHGLEHIIEDSSQ